MDGFGLLRAHVEHAVKMFQKMYGIDVHPMIMAEHSKFDAQWLVSFLNATVCPECTDIIGYDRQFLLCHGDKCSGVIHQECLRKTRLPITTTPNTQSKYMCAECTDMNQTT